MHNDDTHPAPSQDLALMSVKLWEGDDVDKFASDIDDEAIAARTSFTWTVKFTVSGTWVADGFNLDHERAMSMLRNDLGFAREDELDAQVLSAPPEDAIAAIQGAHGDAAMAGQMMLDELLAAEVRSARDREAWVAAGGYVLPVG